MQTTTGQFTKVQLTGDKFSGFRLFGWAPGAEEGTELECPNTEKAALARATVLAKHHACPLEAKGSVAL